MVKTAGSGSMSMRTCRAGVFEALAVRVRQEHHRLFGMIDAVGSQARLVVDDEGDCD